MCSVTTNSLVEQQLADLEHSNNRQLIEKRLFQFASEASPSISGALDIAGMHGMPAELRDVRKKRIGRHRVFYTGHHTQCCYNVIYIKEFKKTGVEDENDQRFQRMLIRALSESRSYEIVVHKETTDPNDTESQD